MVDWNPGSDPFPDREIKAITDFEFLDDLRFIRRSKRLAQTPKHPLWSFVGPIGPHLEASILHDYLCLAWTDFRETASKRDWNFADAVFLAGMHASQVPKRRLIHAVVHSPTGWSAFRKRNNTLKQLMDQWLPHMSTQRGTNG